ncbi:LPS export ABC transporter periplasmic protein LptC [Bordetella avium]|uniref:LPS export ABC transporter periplasmic protein LptC n=1 Tax=Bordetella avium TaxID=521 RepID=UPI000E0AB7E3|nr:LPS export ABC transporter periplasmic protein LptC [Bordetella avium]AZY53847.1 LPS export ABC transporter periplasmic protein LptC [Bordetella avium]RIQ15380.1 LPS export ABC transporter periplasmic protein LptC [Bordetella avium]RIQ38511.1 LPS export ABC transporter periplasmic protein LptC [Bordetella avium]RIQ43050.1 LPS export ABC transporter periplasmic protein LptC [Bordetella avium]RIQ44015.1 LPS export ABC transporter periplasmic protein LptC [Bordetella avium]
MKERLPTLIALFLLVSLVISTWWAADYAQRAIPIDPPRRITHEKDAWSRDFVMLRTDAQGKPINRMEGVYGEHFPDDDSYHVVSPRAIGQQANNPVTVAVSKTAIMEEGGKRVVMNGDAHVHRNGDANNDALDVRSQQLILIPDDDLVFTDLPAQVIKGNSRMNGTGMRYNNKTRQLEVHASTDVEIAGSESRRQNAGPSTPNQNKP